MMFGSHSCGDYEHISDAIEGIPALVSSLDPAGREEFLKRCSAGPGDLVLFAVGPLKSVNKTLDRLRLYVAHELGLVDHVSSQVLYFDKFYAKCFFPFSLI